MIYVVGQKRPLELANECQEAQDGGMRVDELQAGGQVMEDYQLRCKQLGSERDLWKANYESAMRWWGLERARVKELEAELKQLKGPAAVGAQRRLK